MDPDDAVARILGPLDGLPNEFFARHFDRFYVRRHDGNWDRVRWQQVSYAHLAYFDDTDGCWKLVPGRERLFQQLVEEETA